VPTLLISPLGTKKTITSQTFDHTSILRMIEWRWNLPPLTVRDETATNLAEAFTFGKTKLHAPAYRVPATTIPTACVTGAALVDNEWFGLMSVARQWGWSVG
jgi:phospholipase C